MPAVIGQRIDSYEIIALLGRGGMAEVYHARQVLRGGVIRDVALKLIDPHLSELPEFNARFDREAQTLISLSNPHILKAFDYGLYQNSAYLVMELMPGGSLSELLRQGTLPYERVIQFMDQIGAALDYAHSRGIIHRDLKPQNVLLDATGNGYLTDFGIVKLMGEQSTLTRSQMVVGTPSYMSPEQGTNQPIDGRSDLYAFGVLLFEMLAGRVPFTADTPVQVLFKHAYEPPPQLTSIRPDAPPALDQVLAKALAKSPDDRYQSAAALTADLKAALNNQPVNAPIRSVAPVPDTPTEALNATPLSFEGSTPASRPARAVPRWRRNPLSIREALIIGFVIVISIATEQLVLFPALRQPRTATPPSIESSRQPSSTVRPQSPIPVGADLSSPTPATLPPATTLPTATISISDLAGTADGQVTRTAAAVLSQTPTPNLAASVAVLRTQHAVETQTDAAANLTASATLWTATATLAPTRTPDFTPTALPTDTPSAAPATANTISKVAPTDTPGAALHAGTTRTDKFGVSQVYVPAGCFLMGSDPAKDPQARTEEQPQHQVCISKSYWLDQFDVTNAAFDTFVKAGGYSDDSLWSSDGLSWKKSDAIIGPGTKDSDGGDCTRYSSRPKQPRVCINYYEAEAYAKWRGGRLPTEAEWEYAARGSQNLVYPWGDTFDLSNANTTENKIGKTTVVDAYPTGKSWVDAYDMAGNVWQWVTDWYRDRYSSASPSNDPTGPNSGQDRVLRGGSWNDFLNNARAASRGMDIPSDRYGTFGIRVVDDTAPTAHNTVTATPPTGGSAVETSTVAATDTPATALRAGTTRTDKFGVSQVYVPAGCFQMGSTAAQVQQALDQFAQVGINGADVKTAVADELPQHQVCMSSGYWLDQFDVTKAEFDAFVKASSYSNDFLWSNDGLIWKQTNNIKGPISCMNYSSQAKQPMICVSYYEAEAYAKWRGGRLPTEAEWEYAARGTTGWRFPWGDVFDQSKANTKLSGIGKTSLVDAYPGGKSWVGAYDMAGNAWQWVSDWYSASYYASSPITDPSGPASGTMRVLRGGSWDAPSGYASVTFRFNTAPSARGNGGSFRVVVPG